jgi:Transposase DDE domain
MSKKSIGRKPLISQCLSRLPLEDFDCPLIDYRNYKLKTKSLIKIFVSAHLGQWSSYEEIEEELRAHPVLRKELNITSISGSQLSRRIKDLPTEWLEKLFIKIVNILKQMTKSHYGYSKTYGLLKIVDSTEIKLPKQLCDWAFISKGRNAVKMHTRLVITSPNTVFPDKIVPSSGNVSDFETSNLLIEEDDATYLMDRGYPSRKNLMDWLEKNILFVTRISKSLRLFSLEENEPTHPQIIRDAKVNFGSCKKPVRYIEFEDEEKTVYRILTTRWDLTDREIMELYKQRWMIELFFKWIKSHLKLTKIWSTDPKGIWNQMFLALIAYALSVIVKLETGSTKTQWGFFRLLGIYLFKTMKEFELELFRYKKTSKGRQKIPIPRKRDVIVGSVAKWKEIKIKK